MSPVDGVLILLAIGAAAIGWRNGFVAGAFAVAGFLLGLLGGRLVGPWASAELVAHGWIAQASMPALTVAFPLVLGVCASGLGGYLGAVLRDRISDSSWRIPDAAGGALSGVVAFLLIVWLSAGWVATTSLLAPNRWAADSGAVALLDRIAPITSTEALGSIGTALADNGFPQVFAGQREQIRDVGEPSPAMVQVGREAEASIVKIVSTRTVCGRMQEGSGWVFAPGLIATNAHVVAGSQELMLQVRGVGAPFSAEVVAFDPDADVAVLRVPGLDAPVLPRGAGLQQGDDSVVVGFPENGPYTISPTRVRERLQARGLDIYSDESVVRDVYSLRGIIRPGNSGGPLLDTDGHAVGMIFARSASDAETGYALTLEEIEGVLSAGQNSTMQVATGACTTASAED